MEDIGKALSSAAFDVGLYAAARTGNKRYARRRPGAIRGRMVRSAAPSSILITGASSGIGEALALAYARPGATLSLSGRDQGRLDAVAAACRGRGAAVEVKALDVTDAAAMGAWIAAADDRAPLDLVVANAGISSGTSGRAEDEARVRALFAVNVDGVLNTVLPAIPRMGERGRGQLALISSIAAFRGFAGASAYCATKAAVKVFGEGLRLELAEHGVRVSVVCPGYVTTRMTARNAFPMPFLMPADRAAQIIVRGLERDRPRIVFPLPMHIAVWLVSTLPPALLDPILRRLPRKT
jgi:short-subunit dehydrogenase